jgi:hypothetical protein
VGCCLIKLLQLLHNNHFFLLELHENPPHFREAGLKELLLGEGSGGDLLHLPLHGSAENRPVQIEADLLVGEEEGHAQVRAVEACAFVSAAAGPECVFADLDFLDVFVDGLELC